MQKLCLYDKLVAGDLLTPIRRHLAEGRFILSFEGKVTENQRIDFERPWLVPVVEKERNCSRWFAVYFDLYQIIPKGCRNCWKVGFHPRTLEDVFKVLEIQEKMGISSKSGLEKRGRTGAKGGYSSFWYPSLSDGVKGGREVFKRVKEVLENDLGYSDGLTLKRGCTEMEHFSLNFFGSSADWDKRASAFDLTEKLLDSVFDIPEIAAVNIPKILEVYIKRSWIEWAFEHGDKTYLKYTGGRKLVPSLFDYMKEDNEKICIPITWKGEKNDPSSTIESIV